MNLNYSCSLPPTASRTHLFSNFFVILPGRDFGISDCIGIGGMIRHVENRFELFLITLEGEGLLTTMYSTIVTELVGLIAGERTCSNMQLSFRHASWIGRNHIRSISPCTLVRPKPLLVRYFAGRNCSAWKF
jgi:hypothetical protein